MIMPFRALVVTSIACAQIQTIQAADSAELQREAENWHAKFQEPSEGISLGEISGAERVYASAGRLRKDGGLVDEHTLFEIGSITKVFSGILLADTVLRGKAESRDSIGKHLPSGVIGDDSPLQKVTLLELSTHISGLPRLPGDLREGATEGDPYAHYSRARLYGYLGQFKEEDFEKRGEFLYSNLGVGLLGELVAIINETEYQTLLAERILEPLKMNSTWVQRVQSSEPEGLKARFATGHNGGSPVSYWRLNAFSGAGAMVSSVSDMLNFAEAHWAEETPEYLKKAFALAMEPHTTRSGLGWAYRETRFSHGGGTGGFRTTMEIEPEKKYAKVNLRNSSGERIVTSKEGDFSEIAGFWSGTLDLGVRKLRIVTRITAHGDVFLYSVDQGGVLIPSAKTAFADGKLSVSYPTISGHYIAKLKDGKLAGAWTQGREDELNMERSQEMPQPLAEAFDRIYEGDLSRLKGYWRGRVGDTEDGLFVYLQVAPVDDQRHEAAVWAPTMSPLPTGVSKIKFDGTQFMVELNSPKGTYLGEIDEDRKTIKGVWSADNDSPITWTWSAEKPETPNGPAEQR